MKKLTLPCLALALLVPLSGCFNLQALNLEALKIDTTQKTFVAPSYYGKELPSAFLTSHSADEGDGHQFRGFHFGKRHWKF